MTDPIASMLECHERIRRFTEGLGRLAALDDLTDPRAPTAASQCARYFREGLPLHAADEDQSLAPRLRAAGVTRAVTEALDRMTDDHRETDAGMIDLLPMLDAIAIGAPPPVARLREGHRWLAGVLLPHVEMEELVIFPACEALAPDVRENVAHEMRLRRR